MIEQPQIIKAGLLKSVAIFRLSALGDVVMMVPVIKTLQATFSQLKLTWIISRPMHALLEGMEGVEFIVIDKPRGLKDYLALRRQLKAYRFDVLLAAQANLRVNLIFPLIKATCRLGFDLKRSRECHHWFVDKQVQFHQNHILESFMQFAFALGATRPELRWDLPVRDEDWAFAKTQLAGQSYVAINPCASKSDRNWPLERNVALMQSVYQRWQLPIVLTGGPSNEEKQIADELVKQAEVNGVPCLSLVGKTSLKQLAAVLGSVKVLVSPDTGPAHLASAMGTPVVGLFADITSKLSAPYMSRDLVVDRYPEAMQQYSNKSVDDVPWVTRVHNPKAMSLITVDDVMQQMEKVLD